MTKPPSPPPDPLVELGFTALEAEIYNLLLEEPAATGYRLAQRLGKAAPNVYKALESLEAKGAVMVDDGKHRRCRAVPPEELLGHLERRFRRARERAARSLAERARPHNDHRVYQLGSPEAVFERCQAMLDRARDVVLADAFPLPVERLSEGLTAAAARGVLTAVVAYRPVVLEGVETVLDPDAALTLERWPAQWLNLVVDGREFLVALLDAAGTTLHQAIWSSSAYLAWPFHSAVGSELTLTAIEGQLKAGADPDTLHRTFTHLRRFQALESAGYRELRHQLGTTRPPTPSP